ncbi:MAG: carboxypeptidase-like regulatory domain-containing protein [Pyrinomonadaceae bacterium]
MKIPQVKFIIQSFAPRILVFVLCVSTFTTFSFGQKVLRMEGPKAEVQSLRLAVAPTPVVFNGNVTCAQLANTVAFPNIEDGDSLKLDFSTPNGTFEFTNGPKREVLGDEYPGLSITVVSSGSTLTSFSSQVSITAVIVKAGDTSYVYPYNPAANSDTGLATGDQNAISHLTFCIGLRGAVTAGEGTISGRVARADGSGIYGARMTVTNAVTGESSTVLTSPFGYYRFEDLDVADLYFVTVKHKRYSFADSMRTFTLNDNLAEVDFVASP